MINQYTVIYSHNLDLLVTKVGLAIAEGWQPLGGIAIRGNDIQYMQAMTYTEPIAFTRELPHASTDASTRHR